MATQLKPTIECSKEEWQARLDLAACYRIFDHLGWSESIYNHISLKVPGEEDTLVTQLFAFIIGVELGQLMIVAIILQVALNAIQIISVLQEAFDILLFRSSLKSNVTLV